jgi:hypothetical protein
VVADEVTDRGAGGDVGERCDGGAVGGDGASIANSKARSFVALAFVRSEPIV